MKHTYKTKNTCSTKITLDLAGDVVSKVQFTGGCAGNLQVIPRLVEGYTVEELEQKCKGIVCGLRGTSCADQLATAVREAYEAQRSNAQ